VAAHQARCVLVEVPLRPSRGEHILGIQAHFMEYEGELIHQGDIDIPLNVLDDLGRLCGLDIPGHKDVGYESIQLCQKPGALLVHAGDDLGYLSMLCASSPGFTRSGE